jgi:23S rRNA (adenine2030-N6)-methyltransferase
MARALQQAAIPDVIQIELCTSADNEQLGMTGSGLFVVNPPWQLTRQMQNSLPWLAQRMADSSGHFGVQRITPEQ